MKLPVAILVASLTLGSGCSLIPKSVEFGQKKVQPFPEQTEKFIETQRQAAWALAQKSQETRDAALAVGAPPTVTRPSGEALLLAGSVSESLGPPLSFPLLSKENIVADLAESLGMQQAKHDRSVRRYATEMEPLEGKKVEGTGWFQVPYFLWVAIVAGVVFVIYKVAQVALAGASVANPAVGLGLGALKLTGSAAGAALRQVVHGGEAFKKLLADSKLSDEIKAEVKSLFRSAQEIKQDEKVKVVVDALTRKPGE